MSSLDHTHYNGIPPKLFEDLLLETLLFARQAAREDISVAKAMFAMVPSVAMAIASLTLPQVRTIAVGNTRRLRVRRDSHPEFWGDLLVACRGRDERALAALRRQGKLLFCGEVVRPQGQRAKPLLGNVPRPPRGRKYSFARGSGRRACRVRVAGPWRGVAEAALPTAH